jgi:inorganic phosphate transporter, PiT family
LLAMTPLLGGIFLGWSLGANGASNMFGSAVGSRIISFRKACVICSLAIIVGALLQGQAGLHALGDLTWSLHKTNLIIISVAAALTVTGMTIFRLPVSVAQAVVGAVTGVILSADPALMPWRLLYKIMICWVATPIGAMLGSIVVYGLLGLFLRFIPMSILTRDKLLWGGLLVVGIYGSYAFGANNVANATGIFAGRFADIGINNQQLALLGGVAMAFGVATYSKRVMMAVGSGIMPLDAFTAMVAVTAMSITIHVFAIVGVPVSASQAIVGAIIGIGIIRRSSAIRLKKLYYIGLGWFMTPVVALILAAAAYAIFSGITS